MAKENGGEGAPVGSGRGGEVCELREDEAELEVGSTWVEEVGNGGSPVSPSSSEFGWTTAMFWDVWVGSWRGNEEKVKRGFSWCWGAREMGVRGTALSWPRRRRGGGRGARRGGVARRGEVQR